MKNAVLHLLTNKNSGFFSTIFPVTSDYKVRTETEAQQEIRQLLRLHITDSDYYLMGALAAVYAFPEILREFNESSKTFKLSDWVRPADTITGAQYHNLPNINFALRYKPKVWPVELAWTISYLDSKNLIIRLGDSKFIVPYTVSSLNILRPDWPEELGIQGALKLDGTWQSSSVLEIRHTPVSYPYDTILNKLSKNTNVYTLLDLAGLSKEFFSAKTSLEKFAILLLALAAP